MVSQDSINQLITLSREYNKECYFEGDPIIFPKHFALLMQGKPGLFCSTTQSNPSIVHIDKESSAANTTSNDITTLTASITTTGSITVGDSTTACNSITACDTTTTSDNDAMPTYIPTLKDVEIAGIIAAHLAWGRRDMIIRDCKRAFDEMCWQPYNYVMAGKYKDDDVSLHRTIKWSEFAQICTNLKEFYSNNSTLESLDADQIRVQIYSQKSNPKAANKKIHMFRRWMVRNDGVVDLGLWKNSTPAQLVIPLDVHVHRTAINLGITSRKGADITTAQEITDFLKTIFPEDPCKGDFALFAYAATKLKEQEIANKGKQSAKAKSNGNIKESNI